MAEAEEGERVVVCDAGPLIHLDELDCVDLLSSFLQVWVPKTVWKEIELHRPSALSSTSVRLRLATVDEIAPEVSSIARLFSLHPGELDAIQLAKQINADILLTDDSAARLAAGQLSIRVHGTIGILLRAFRLGHKSKVEIVNLLRELPRSCTIHVRPSLLENIINEVEQQ